MTEQTNGSFASMGLAAPLLTAIENLGFTQPTPVQAEAIPAAINGGDWMVSSQTGSGKTAAFLLPVLNAIMSGSENSPIDLHRVIGPAGLVLCPTRELAQQVAQDAIDLLKNSKGVRVATVMGGMPYGKQMAGLRGALLVVATPGRLLDLAQRRQIHLADVKTLVVDEADRMLDLGFAEDLEDINHLCQKREQTLMFSATFAPRIMSLASRLMKSPGRLELASATDRHTQITQSLHWADNMIHKEKLLDHYLRDADLEQAVVFASTQVETDRLADALAEQGHAVAALHGAMPQKVRAHRLKQLRSGHVRVLVATDVAARGIDVPSITHVFNFGLPMKAEDYVHRIGRTGRAGRTGKAITFAEHRDRMKIRTIEALTDQRIPVAVVAGLEPKTPERGEGRGGRGEGRGRPGGFGGGEGRGRPGGFGGGRGAFGGHGRGGDSKPREFGDRPPRSFEDRPARSFSDRPREDRPARSFDDRPRSFDDKPRSFGDRNDKPRSFSDRPREDRPRSFEDRPRSFDDKPRSFGDKPRSFDDKPRGFAGDKPRSFGDKPRTGGGKSFGGPKPWGDKPAGKFGDKPRSEGRSDKPAGKSFSKPAGKTFSKPVGKTFSKATGHSGFGGRGR
ncbi:MAG: DEAD/DEAH box helicase [Rhodocyclaceae bacterium]|uniref:DEAD/DEAH box helicase n=1 Tax=Fluviibacter phosphoraccumulans TaxID=1751046 RepID=UPI001B4F6FFA|nr:DEAD/DEAH box helicase [Fluviibacter phosphoraccumulans]MBP7918107.1 DEAD/DEAH box helicase [Rhodocyclaceae bacterium]MBP7991890.1 DEAD/DEAH box helicase [Rhodocyclaceae bacterium]